jgi:glycosyltransferase involved in cell wall biosynthesis
MKVAIVTAYPPSKVTLTEYAFHLVKSFRKQEDITEIVLLTDHTDEEKTIECVENGCKVTVKQCWKFNSLKNVITVTKAMREINPDATLYNLQFMKFGDSKVAAALGLLLPGITKWMQIPTIVLLHNIMETVDLDSAGFASNPLMKKIYTLIGKTLTKLILKADTVAVTIPKYVDILKETYGVDHIKHIPHGTFEIAKQPDYNLPDGPLQIMTFGKFGTYKKVEPMIEAVEMVRKDTGLDLEIVIAGTDNPNVKGYLANVAETYKEVPNLRFTGYVPEEDVEKIFSESAVTVFPYTSTTGSSGVLHQAGSYGNAVVMPDLGDLSALVREEGFKGEFFEPNSVASLAKAIKTIVTNPRYRVQMGKQNYKAATAYPMSRIANMYVDAFKEIQTERSGGTIKSSVASY